MKKSEILEIIKEELEVVLTNEEAVEVFDLDLAALLESLTEAEQLSLPLTIKHTLTPKGTASAPIKTRTATAAGYGRGERAEVAQMLKDIAEDGEYSEIEKKRLGWTEHVETFIGEVLEIPAVLEDEHLSAAFSRAAELFRKQLYAIVRKVHARKRKEKKPTAKPPRVDPEKKPTAKPPRVHPEPQIPPMLRPSRSGGAMGGEPTGRHAVNKPLREKKRTAKGNITQATRKKHATVGKDKFPIFDKKSAEAAIDLRGHAPEADRAKIINKAAKYAPAAAKKAREADKKKKKD